MNFPKIAICLRLCVPLFSTIMGKNRQIHFEENFKKHHFSKLNPLYFGINNFFQNWASFSFPIILFPVIVQNMNKFVRAVLELWYFWQTDRPHYIGTSLCASNEIEKISSCNNSIVYNYIEMIESLNLIIYALLGVNRVISRNKYDSLSGRI